MIDSDEPGPRRGERTVTAVLHYRTPEDPADVTARRRLVLLGSPAWHVLSDDPVGAALPWDLGTVRYEAAGHAAVLAVAAPGDLAAAADSAVAAVDAVWGTAWRQPVVVVAVPDQPGLAALTGRTVAGVAGLVAVSTPDRVYVDLAAYDALDGPSRSVLLTHEVTHVATAAGADRATPQWLKEGFADYVGFLHSGIPVRTAAAALLAHVRESGPPAAVPDDAAFDPVAAVAGSPADAVADAYAGAWLMCSLVATTDGAPALVAVYRATAAGTGTEQADVDAALRQVTGTSLGGWTSRWRAELARLAA